MKNKNLTVAVIPALALALVLVAVTSSFASSGTGAVAGQQGASQSAPLAWSGLLQVSQQPFYDNTPSIAASPLNAGVTIAWEERDEGVGHAFGAIMQASNNGVGAPLNNQEVDRSGWKEIGNPVVRADLLGRRHIAYFEQSGGGTCGKYAQVGANGVLATVETIPNSCGGFFKRVAVAVGPDNSVHVALGRDNTNVYYFQRAATGQWVVQNELVYQEANNNDPVVTAIAVSTGGIVMAAWLQRPNGGGKYDVITGRRTGPGAWVFENISASCCTGCSFDANTYSPALQADRLGGIRAAWADEQCSPRTEPRNTDLYHRQWVPGTGWDNQPIVLVDAAGGQQFWTSISVDNAGHSHIVYGSDADRPRDTYTLAAVTGSGTSFTAPERPFMSNPSFMKEVSSAHGPGYIFATFSSAFNAPQFKTVYYAYKDIPDVGVVTPTATPTNTPTPVPPRCPNERFTDVCPEDFFYAPALGLDMRNIMNGYNSVPPCAGASHVPCFKPENNITRAQIAKVIALGARLPANLEGAPHFQDVSSDHTFYTYIEFAYNAGVITGYPCGSLGEPCQPGNRPYFRPGNNVTRGQLSKMVAIGFNYNEPVNGQSFQDVPPTHTFYEWIERLAGRGLIGGYPCGGLGEPCLPGNRPYFRPNNNLTRGQGAKIIYEAVVDLEENPTTTPTAEATATVDATATPDMTATPELTATPEITATATSILPTITIIPTLTVLPTLTLTPVAGR